MAAPTLTGLISDLTIDENVANAGNVLIDSAVVFGDAEGDFNGGKLIVSGLLPTIDVIFIRNVGGAGQIGVTGFGPTFNVTYSGVVIGSFVSTQTASFEVTLNSAATSVAVDALIQSLIYRNNSSTPEATRTLYLNVRDASGADLGPVAGTASFAQVTGATNPFNGNDVGFLSTPALLDIDGDGDLDVVAGDNYGFLRTFRNQGTGQPFVEVTGAANPFNGIDIGERPRPGFVDFDGDGDLDAVVGELRGTFLAFRNNGIGQPVTALTGAANPFAGIDVGFHSSPSFVDIDGDGDLDGVVGNAYGQLRVFRNDGPGAAFVEVGGASNPFSGIATGYDTAAGFVDLDGDGDLDTVMGDNNGTLRAFRNDGVGQPAVELTGAANPFGTLDVGRFSVPAFGDIDRDGNLDAVIGEQFGTFLYYRNTSPRGQAIVVNVIAQDDPPQLFNPGFVTFVEGNNVPSVAIKVAPSFAVTDTDGPATLTSAQVAITNFRQGEDLLIFTPNDAYGFLSGSYDSATGILTLSAGEFPLATLAQYQAAIRSVDYLNTSENPNTTARTTTIQAFSTDGQNPVVSAVFAGQITVSAVADRPVVTLSASSANFVEGLNSTSTPVVIDPALTLTDVDSATLVNARVSIGAGFDGSQDVLGFVPGAAFGNIVGNYSSGTLTLTSAGNTATLAQFEAALRSVTYSNSSDTPTTTTRTIDFTAFDGAAINNFVTRNVTITTVNDAPVAAASSGSAAYTEGGSVAIDPALILTDDNGSIASATAAITGNFQPSQDVLAFTAGATFGNIAGSYDAATGVLSLTSAGSTASIAQFQAALRSILYRNTSDAPDTALRTITFTASDATSTGTASTRTLTVAGVADVPVVTTSPGSEAFVEGANVAGTPVVIDAGLTLADIDSPTLASASVRITANLQPGQDVLGFTPDAAFGNITASFASATGILTLTSTGSTATLGQFQAALRSVTFTNLSDTPTTATRTILFSVNDGTVTSLDAGRTVTVTAVNDAPVVITSAGAASFTEGGSVAVDAGLILTDDTATLASASLAIIGGLQSPQDTLNFTAGAAFGNIVGSFDALGGTLSLTSSGATATVARFQAALRSVTFTNASDNPGSAVRTISIVANDGAFSSEVATRTLAITPVNDAPRLTGTTSALTIAEGTAPVLIAGSATLADVDANLNGGVVSVTGLSSDDRITIVNQGTGSGQISVSGSDVSFGGTAIGTVAGGAGTTFTVTLNGSATDAGVTALVRNLTYSNASDAPIATRTLVLDITDGAGANLGTAPGAPTFAGFEGAPFPFNNSDLGVTSRPVFTDIDNDGDADLFVGDELGSARAYRNNGDQTFTQVGGVANPFNGVTVNQGFAPGFVDFDGDGDQDGVVGSEPGTLRAFRNNGVDVAFTELTGSANPFAGLDVGRFSAPAFVDLDGDGDFDAVVGARYGALFAYRNNGAGQPFTALVGSANPFNGIDVGYDSKPAFIDLDGDGDLDAIVGEIFGSLVAYRNNGANQAFTAFGGHPLGFVSVGSRAGPGVGDIDGDGDLDVAVGNTNGFVTAYQNTTPQGRPIVITVTAQNDAPVLGDPTALFVLVPIGEPTAVLQGVTVADPDLPASFAGGSFTIALSGVAGVLGLNPASGFTIAGGTITDTASGLAIAAVTGLGTANVTVSSLNGNASRAIVDRLVQAFTAEVPNNSTDNRTVTLVFNDGGNTGGGGALSDAVVQIVQVPGPNIVNGTTDAGETLTGTAGADYFNALAGNDLILALGGDDRAYGQAGNDRVALGAGTDLGYGGLGIDTLDYSSGAGAIFASLANRTVGETGFVTTGATVSAANAALTTDSVFEFENIIGTRFGDRIYGDAGANVIALGAGNDIGYGGAGIDTVDYRGATGAVFLSLTGSTVSETGLTTGTVQAATAVVSTDFIYQFENIVGSAFGDRIYGNAGDNVIDAGAGSDIVYGGGGNDTIDYATARGSVYVDLTNSYAVETALTTGTTNGSGEVTRDSLNTFANATGSSFGDRLYGTVDVNILDGGAGDDILYGLAGNDILRGGAGNDLLIGGAGSDTATGGAGNDRFYFTATTDGVDTITDFTSADDDLFFFSGAFGGGAVLAASGSGVVLGAAFFYDMATGALSYSATGVEAAGVAIAQLGAGTALVQNDLVFYG